MSKRTRLFVAVASAILVVGLCTGLLVAYANVRDVMDSELRRKLSTLQPDSSRGPEHFKEQTGIDLETDVDYIVASFAGMGEPPQGEPPLVLARGRFDQVRIEGLVRDQGGTVEEYKGARLLVNQENRLALVFLEPGLVAIGGPAAVRASIDTKAAGSSVKNNDEVMRLVRDLSLIHI